jgi:predicted N-formylglutamate amidohydrolase
MRACLKLPTTRYRGLGLPERELSRHIAWDIGAAELTRHLATRLDAIAFLAGASRLLVDCNRPLDSPTLIPEISEIPIPGNRNIDDTERQERVRTWFKPLHAAIAHCLFAPLGARSAPLADRGLL